MKMNLRKKLLALMGTTVLVAGLLTLVRVLPKLTPYDLLRCRPDQGGIECFGGMNPAYPILFIVAIGGLVMLFLGVFGRNFVVTPLFVSGVLIEACGLSGIIFGYIGFESCAQSPYSLCMAYHPEFNEPWVLAGSILISANVLVSSFLRLHRLA